MKLLADSGSTKTEWCLIQTDGQTRRLLTKGINPYFQTSEEVAHELRTNLRPQLPDAPIDALYFYGAGCSPEKAPAMRQTLADNLPVEAIEVHSDMLGAARALSGRRPGIIGILGTGSNSCFYDGEAITHQVSPLGYILGDEGSGAVLGKLLVGDLLKHQLPEPLRQDFLDQFHLTPAQIIERVYRQPFPNRFLAGFSPFLAQRQHIPEVRALIRSAFLAYLDRNIAHYDYRHHPLHLVGSIAHYYRDILQEAIASRQMQLGNLLQAPMQGLIAYHQVNEAK
jgi:N-acetylglucosamine kinase-like BadF-type ATPase